MDEGLEFLQGDTEGDCLRTVKRGVAPVRAGYFARVVEAWQLIAYAHRSLARDSVLALADGWPAAFPPPAAQSREARA